MTKSTTLAISPGVYFSSWSYAGSVMLAACNVNHLLVSDLSTDEPYLILEIRQTLRMITMLSVIQILLFLFFLCHFLFLVTKFALIRISPREATIKLIYSRPYSFPLLVMATICVLPQATRVKTKPWASTGVGKEMLVIGATTGEEPGYVGWSNEVALVLPQVKT